MGLQPQHQFDSSSEASGAGEVIDRGFTITFIICNCSKAEAPYLLCDRCHASKELHDVEVAGKHLPLTQVERGNKKEKRLHYRIPRLLQPGTDAEAAEMKSCLDCAIEMNCRHQHHRQHIVFICLFYSDSETMAS